MPRILTTRLWSGCKTIVRGSQVMSLIDSPAFRWMSGWCPKAQWGTAEWDHISVPPSWELGSFFWSYTKPMSVWLVRVGKGTARRVALPDVMSVRSSLWCIEQHWSPRCNLQHNLWHTWQKCHTQTGRNRLISGDSFDHWWALMGWFFWVCLSIRKFS